LMEQKAALRALGAVLGGGYALASMVLLFLEPSFLLLLALLFFGMFLSAYLTLTSRTFSYAFLQMGMVLAMVLFGPTGGVGSPGDALTRLVGVVAGLVVAEAVFFLWPRGAARPAGP